MNSIKAIIVDDEASARNVLEALLERSPVQVDVIARAENVLQAVELIKQNPPDVVFLDVEMPNYSGYEIVNFFDEINFNIIFITAYDSYAIKAFELSAVDYLLKPINRIRLYEALNKLTTVIEKERQIEDYSILLESMKSKEPSKIVIPELGKKRVIDLSELVAIEASGAYSILHLRFKKPITVSKNLKYFEESLAITNNFYRSHKSWVVNTKFIQEYNPSQLSILLEGGVVAKLSKYKKEAFDAVLA